MKITLIAALSRNRVIGRDNTLPWKLPEDLKRFRALTRGHPVIMGRKTFESIGRPLPDRLNLIVSRRSVESQPEVSSASGATAVEWHSSLEAALTRAKGAVDAAGLSQVFVIGGGEIYRLALPMADCLELTWVDVELEGDAYFPEFDPSAFQEVSREDHPADPTRPAFSFCRYEKTSNLPRSVR